MAHGVKPCLTILVRSENEDSVRVLLYPASEWEDKVPFVLSDGLYRVRLEQKGYDANKVYVRSEEWYNPGGETWAFFTMKQIGVLIEKIGAERLGVKFEGYGSAPLLPKGTKVRIKDDDGFRITTHTQSPPFEHELGGHYVWCHCVRGAVRCDLVQKLE
ncbi:MAG: hypothetical protein KKB70_00390 [Proteobacteria bacterium]|nr:hypothetical protein [Pseudomonadota bacterium]